MEEISQNSLVISKSESQTISLGEKIGEKLKIGDIVALFGSLGSGKTIFTKGIAKGVGVKNIEQVVSPSFIFMNIYQGKFSIYHFDLYRLENIYQIYQIGWDDFLENEAIIIIEWADKIKSILPKEYFCIKLEIINKKERKIQFIPIGDRYKQLIRKFGICNS